jgi:predicted transcriptional regulator
MSEPGLFDVPAPRRMADTSLEQWGRIVDTLPQREKAVYLGLCDYVLTTSHPDATGAELAEFMGLDKTSTRPRLTGLCDSGLVRREPIRQSRAKGEGRCHPYMPLVAAAAVRRSEGV